MFNFAQTLTLEISATYGKQAQISLLNVQGKTIESTTLSTGKATWYAPKYLPAGMYYLQIVGNGKTETIKIIKQ